MEARESFWDLRVINLPKDAEGRIWHITAVRSVGVLPWWREAVVTWWGPSAPSSVLLANVYRVTWKGPEGSPWRSDGVRGSLALLWFPGRRGEKETPPPWVHINARGTQTRTFWQGIWRFLQDGEQQETENGIRLLLLLHKRLNQTRGPFINLFILEKHSPRVCFCQCGFSLTLFFSFLFSVFWSIQFSKMIFTVRILKKESKLSYLFKNINIHSVVSWVRPVTKEIWHILFLMLQLNCLREPL